MRLLGKNLAVSPLPDETLMSFLTRTAVDLCITWQDFLRITAGSYAPSARHGERKSFDWDRLSEMVGVTPDTLFGMSERSLFLQRDDTARLSRQKLRRMPWTGTKGYSVYSPAALGRSDHLRLSWHRPDILVDLPSGTLFLRLCGDCRTELANVRWGNAISQCPCCGSPLGAAIQIKAPVGLIKYLGDLSPQIDTHFRSKPVNAFAPVITHCAAVWHVAAQLKNNPEFAALRSYLIDAVQAGSWMTGLDEDPSSAGAEAMHYAQLWVAADYACKQYPEVTHRFDLMIKFSRYYRSDHIALSRGLRELMQRLSLA